MNEFQNIKKQQERAQRRRKEQLKQNNKKKVFRNITESKMNELTTKELVEELEKREGVEIKIADPYKDVEIKVNGPAKILIVID